MTSDIQDPVALMSTTAARRLESFVLEGGFKSGDKLPSERELALQFGISRTAIREGIKLLTQNGLLQSSIGRGLFVGQLSTKPVLSTLNVLLHLGGGTAMDVVQVRNALETLAAELAAVHITDGELAEMVGLIDDMAELHAAGKSFGLLGGPGHKFHLAMARASRNPLLIALIEPVLTLTNRAEPAPHQGPQHSDRGVDSHRRIWDALAARDPQRAVSAVQQHCQLVMEIRNQVHPDWGTHSYTSTAVQQEVVETLD